MYSRGWKINHMKTQGLDTLMNFLGSSGLDHVGTSLITGKLTATCISCLKERSPMLEILKAAYFAPQNAVPTH